jgi:hypothetical protein
MILLERFKEQQAQRTLAFTYKPHMVVVRIEALWHIVVLHRLQYLKATSKKRQRYNKNLWIILNYSSHLLMAEVKYDRT